MHWDRNSLEMGSFFGGSNCTGVFGSNLAAIVEDFTGGYLLVDPPRLKMVLLKELSGRRGV